MYFQCWFGLRKVFSELAFYLVAIFLGTSFGLDVRFPLQFTQTYRKAFS